MGTFYSRYVPGFLGAVLLEQAIVASSTLWIARLTEAVTTSRQIVLWLFLFLASLTLVYLPTSIKNYCIQASKLAAHRGYVARFAAAFHDRAILARSNKLRDERHAYVTSEAWLVVDEFFEFVSLAATLSANVTLGIAALGLAVTPFVILAYAGSLPLLAISLYLSSPILAKRSATAQTSRAALTQTLVGAWDAILIGNVLNFRIWSEDFESRHGAFRRASLRSILTMEVAAALSMVVSLLPLFVILAWIFFRTGTSVAALAIAAATLPRQVQTIQNLGDTVVTFMKWPGVHAKVRGLLSALRLPTDPATHCGTVHNDRVLVNTPAGELLPLEACRTRLIDEGSFVPAVGRWTLRGPNGSGKSSFLAAMKARLGPCALLLPAVTDMPFRSTARRSLSTGERTKAILGEVAREEDVKVLLLDEWDANLDYDTLTDISAAIDKLAETRCVVEVRHRTQDEPLHRPATRPAHVQHR